MLDSPIIDIAIGLSFLYFLFGLITSSLNELIQTKLQSRSKELHGAIINFLDRDWDEIGQKVTESPYIRTLGKSDKKFPSYIPSSSFAQSIIDVIKGAEDLPTTIPEIREQIKKNPIIKGQAQIWILGLLDQSYGKLEGFYAKIESSYNDAMDRVSGWYGAKVKRNILLLGILTSVALNIDTIDITKTLWKNKETAKAFSELVTNSMDKIEKSGSGFEVKGDDGEILYSLKNTPVANVSNIVAQVGSFPIPLGWGKDSFAFFSQPMWGWALLSKIVGWAITALAIFLGAPFWFDLLSKIVNLRGTGKKPEEAASPN
jgi:hypothetical protein